MKRNVKLEVGKTYTNRNGFNYRCSKVINNGAYEMISDSDYCFYAHNITMYEDGTIEWDYSTGGWFI